MRKRREYTYAHTDTSTSISPSKHLYIHMYIHARTYMHVHVLDWKSNLLFYLEEYYYNSLLYYICILKRKETITLIAPTYLAKPWKTLPLYLAWNAWKIKFDHFTFKRIALPSSYYWFGFCFTLGAVSTIIKNVLSFFQYVGKNV